MSARSQQQTAAVLADKKRFVVVYLLRVGLSKFLCAHILQYRQRREARIREHYDRISAALTNTDSTRFAARHPTRVIPDVPGLFTHLKTFSPVIPVVLWLFLSFSRTFIECSTVSWILTS